jgi:hypothetical protein
MVTILPAHAPVTPVGKPVNVAPVAPDVAYVMAVMDEFIHLVCWSVPTDDVRVIVLFGVTVILPVAKTLPQPPVRGIE